MTDFGETNSSGGSYDGNDSGNDGFVLCCPAAAPGSGTLQSMSFYAVSAAGQVNLGLYADVAGAPGALLASTGLFTPANGWNTQSTAGIPIVNGTTYWLAFSVTSGSLTNPHFAFNAPFNGDLALQSGVTPGSLPNPLVSSPGSAGHWAIYATFGSGPAPTNNSLFFGSGSSG